MVIEQSEVTMANAVQIRAHHLGALKEYLTEDKELFYNVNRTQYGEHVAIFITNIFGKIERGEAKIMLVLSLDDICRECCCSDAECRIRDEGPDTIVMRRIGLEAHKSYSGQDVCKRLIAVYGGRNGRT
ncbi:MAG: hypothetical protein V1734_00230 [Nanoarchaeota archaeon]